MTGQSPLRAPLSCRSCVGLAHGVLALQSRSLSSSEQRSLVRSREKWQHSRMCLTVLAMSRNPMRVAYHISKEAC